MTDYNFSFTKVGKTSSHCILSVLTLKHTGRLRGAPLFCMRVVQNAFFVLINCIAYNIMGGYLVAL